ncbi:hypothetical protein NKR23_g6812 [Pleurostoma richardsiae]|uniref:Uncharacterized protein n=1 Tax=Pleurostoma richardsiae TaxID=41990 RepID=A0AA38RCH9_9PEZI|nr:hypothetical protein NKR23_g6812 [Pleurostoma richardsiae]
MSDDYEFFSEAKRVLSHAQGGWLQRFLSWRSYTRITLSKFHFLFNNSDRVKTFDCSVLGNVNTLCQGYDFTLHQSVNIDIHMRVIAEILLQGIRSPKLGRGQSTVRDGIPKLKAPPGLKKQALMSGLGFHAGQGPCLRKIISWISAILAFGLAFVPVWLASISSIDLQNAFAPVTFWLPPLASS